MFKLIRMNCNNVNVTAVAYRHSYVKLYTEENIKLLSETCGFSRIQITLLMRKRPQLHQIEPVLIKESFQFCKNIGLSHNDMIAYPGLLVTHPVLKYNQYNSLLDTGCHNIDALLLCSARKFLGRKISYMKKRDYLDPNINVADKLMECLNPPIEKPEKLSVEMSSLDEMSWTNVHKEILVPWLKVRLKATDEEITRFLRIHKMIINKSFRMINENICFAESLGINKEKILKCGFILHNHIEYPKTMLKKHPFFAGIDIAKVYRVNPKMMMVNPARFDEIYKLLQEYNVTDEQIQHKPDVFLLSPYTLRDRLDQIPKVPELRPLLKDHRMLKLVVHHNKISSRLDFLRTLKMRCASFKNIGCLTDSLFEQIIQDGKDTNYVTDVVGFFSRLLNKPGQALRPILSSHPYFDYIPYMDIEETYECLIELGYNEEGIARCPLILLYPRDRVKDTILRLRGESKFKMRPQNKQLNLALYHIEKQFHFTGNGVWRTDLFADTSDIIELE